MKFLSKNIDETREIAREFAKKIEKTGAFVCFYGEIGSGKTTFIKFLLEELGVKEAVTSPSFVIMNEYHSGKLPVYHFDLYRLENDGLKTIVSELVEYSKPQVLTLVEWANFGEEELPENRINVNVSYVDDGRSFEFIGL